MPDFDFTHRNDFQRMIDAKIEETLTLEYKASPALTRNSKDVDEMCKDVSAMANSAGGQIVYGIEEDKNTHKPAKVDDGVKDDKITREWIIQILNSRIQPRIDAVRIQRIPLSEAGSGFVINIPPTQTGPHQAPDKKYYRRFELHSVPMEDYEIRDVMRRSTTPNLHLALILPSARFAPSFAGNADGFSTSFPLKFSIVNTSPQPAEHVIVKVGIDSRLQVTSYGRFQRARPQEKSNNFHLFISPPDWLPIFKEAGDEQFSGMEISVRMNANHPFPKEHLITSTIQTPGFTRDQRWHFIDHDKFTTLDEVVSTDLQN